MTYLEWNDIKDQIASGLDESILLDIDISNWVSLKDGTTHIHTQGIKCHYLSARSNEYHSTLEEVKEANNLSWCSACSDARILPIPERVKLLLKANVNLRQVEMTLEKPDALYWDPQDTLVEILAELEEAKTNLTLLSEQGDTPNTQKAHAWLEGKRLKLEETYGQTLAGMLERPATTKLGIAARLSAAENLAKDIPWTTAKNSQERRHLSDLMYEMETTWIATQNLQWAKMETKKALIEQKWRNPQDKDTLEERTSNATDEIQSWLDRYDKADTNLVILKDVEKPYLARIQDKVPNQILLIEDNKGGNLVIVPCVLVHPKAEGAQLDETLEKLLDDISRQELLKRLSVTSGLLVSGMDDIEEAWEASKDILHQPKIPVRRTGTQTHTH